MNNQAGLMQMHLKCICTLYLKNYSSVKPCTMKEILFALILGFTFIPAPGGSVFAQNSRKDIEPIQKKNLVPTVRHLAEMMNMNLAAAHILSRNEINIWAIRDFMGRFDNIDHAFWFSTPEGGFESYFNQDGYWDRVYY